MDKDTEYAVIFISYNHKDEYWKDRIRAFLKEQIQLDSLALWDDRMIDAGEEWYDKIKQAMDKSIIAISLISKDYLTSSFITKEEIPHLLKRRSQGGLSVIPILIKGCDWESVRWLASIQMLPRDGKNLEDHYKDTEEIVLRELADQILKKLANPSLLPLQQKSSWPILPKEYINLSDLPETPTALFGRNEVLKILDSAWNDPRISIICLYGWSGIGKTATVGKWLDEIKQNHFCGAERVYATSFQNEFTTAERFIDRASDWFQNLDKKISNAFSIRKDELKDTDNNNELNYIPATKAGTYRSLWDNARYLTKALQKLKTLLILDGFEIMSEKIHRAAGGEICDALLQRVLKKVALNNPGLCIITSRQPLESLGNDSDSIVHVNLEEISKEAGRAILRIGGIKGSDLELEDLSNNFGNNTLAINLLGGFLKSTTGQRASNASLIGDLAIPENRGRHPRRIMEAIAQYLENSPEIDLLHMLSLFQGQARLAELYYLADEWGTIDGLNENIKDLNEDAWADVIANLRKFSLIAPEIPDKPAVIEMHPLAKIHFNKRLKQKNKESWKLAHFVLFSNFVNFWRDYSNLRDFSQILLSAFIHGCLANRYGDVFEQLYLPLIRELGDKISPDRRLKLLSYFYETPWEKLHFIIEADFEGLATYDTGSTLSYLARLDEAKEVMSKAIQAFLKENEHDNAAIANYKLSEIYLNKGDSAGAIQYAEKALKLADENENPGTCIRSLSALASAYHCRGQFAEALSQFQKADNVAKNNSNFVYSHLYYDDFAYCHLLMDLGKMSEAENRLKATASLLDYGTEDFLILGEANLTWGRMLLRKNITTSTLPVIKDHFNKAMHNFEREGNLIDIIRALIERAKFFRMIGDLASSLEDLDEAYDFLRALTLPVLECTLHIEFSQFILELLHNSATMFDSPIEAYELLTMHDAINRRADAAQDHLHYAQGIIKKNGLFGISASTQIVEASCLWSLGYVKGAKNAIVKARQTIEKQKCYGYIDDLEKAEKLILN